MDASSHSVYPLQLFLSNIAFSNASITASKRATTTATIITSILCRIIFHACTCLLCFCTKNFLFLVLVMVESCGRFYMKDPCDDAFLVIENVGEGACARSGCLVILTRSWGMRERRFPLQPWRRWLRTKLLSVLVNRE